MVPRTAAVFLAAAVAAACSHGSTSGPGRPSPWTAGRTDRSRTSRAGICLPPLCRCWKTGRLLSAMKAP